MNNGLLQVEDLRLHYRTTQGVVQAVDGVTFTLSPRQALAVLGESGCGKSSLARAILRLLPRNVAVYDGRAYREQLVDFRGDAFAWRQGDPVRPEIEHYLRSYFPPPETGRWYEANLGALSWMERIALSLVNGYVFTIDYGYTRAESIRFPAGTLMGYRRHTARENVLEEPGARDITAHVNFTALEEYGAAHNLRRERFETLAHTILAAGEADQFAAAMAADRMQLKTLLFGMGETFRVLLQKRD